MKGKIQTDIATLEFILLVCKHVFFYKCTYYYLNCLKNLVGFSPNLSNTLLKLRTRTKVIIAIRQVYKKVSGVERS